MNWAIFFASVVFVIDNTIRIVSLFVIPRNRRPSSGMAWLMAIFLAPIPGLFVFFLIGSEKLPRRRRAKYEVVTEQIEAVASREAATFPIPPEPRSKGLEDAVRIGRALGAQPMLGGNRATLLTDYDRSLAEMAAAIRAAKEYVHIQFYIFVKDEATADIFEALGDAVARGVQVRALADHWGAVSNPGRRRTVKAFKEAGIRWSYMLPVRPLRGEYQRPDLRNHRKILVVDGKVGFMGSQNIVHQSYNKRSNIRRNLRWEDLMVRLEGPSVLGLDAVFRGDWYSETGEILPDATELELDVIDDSNLECQIVPSGPAFATENNLQVFLALIYSAAQRITITSPYFIPEAGLLLALQAATARGVEVELFVSAVGDQPMVHHAQRSYYEQLLNAGVRIYLYPEPTILHSKYVTVDDDVAVFGSSNMDQRSFTLNMEVSMVVHGTDFVTELDKVTDEYRRASHELTQEEWAEQPLRSQLLDNLARLTSALQ